MKGQMDRKIDRYLTGWIRKWKDRQMIDGCIEGQIDRWMGGWIEEQIER